MSDVQETEGVTSWWNYVMGLDDFTRMQRCALSDGLYGTVDVAVELFPIIYLSKSR